MTRDSDPDVRRQQASDWFSRLGAPQVSSDDIRHFFEWRRDLVALMGRSDEVLEVVLRLAGRQELVTARRLSGAREKLREMLALMDDLQS
ncbi:hypothetical protein ACETK8_10070 [Brevundimonas staleyi]|uniref:Uncharacterized protein n=1 Tax=Brevundimonas staleyi TaxID=74326 RepID=A0ABW0FPE8_9CAUL